MLDHLSKLSNDQEHSLYLAVNCDGWLVEEGETSLKECLLDRRIEAKSSLSYLYKLRNFIRTRNIDLVICNSANGGLYGRLAAFRTQAKSIYISHGWSSVYNGGSLSYVFNRIEQVLSIIGDKVVAVSDYDYTIGRRTIGVSASKISRINNSIAAPKTDPIKNYSDEKAQDNPMKLLTVARLAPPKRIDLLLETMVELPDMHLTIVGDGPEGESLRVKAEQLGLGNVDFKGEVKGFEDFRSYTAFVMISESEGLPMAALEAIANSLPVVLSNVGGCVSLVKDNGVLVENTAESIAAGIIKVAENINKYRRKSQELFISEFDLDKNFEKYLSLFQDITKK